jgi:glyoxylase I family protein
VIRGIHHIAIHTANFDRMKQFYHEAFGFEPIGPKISWKDNGEIDKVIGVSGSAARVEMLRAGTCYLEVFEYFAPEGRQGPPLRPHDHGYTHFCVDVTDIGMEYRRLSALGMTFANSEPIELGEIKTVYGKDLDGNIIEIQELVAGNAFSLEHLSVAPCAARSAD